MRTPEPENSKLMVRVKGIEPSSSAWKAVALPLSYTRIGSLLSLVMTIAKDGGGSRTRTYEDVISGFTVRPLCHKKQTPKKKKKKQKKKPNTNKQNNACARWRADERKNTSN